MPNAVPEVGREAPDLTLRGPGGQPITLSEHRGQKNVVLFFYPLAFSQVCSHQLPDVQKELAKFEALDSVVYGVSVDSHHANTAFAKQLGLSFPLLSDFKRVASAAYGVLKEDAGYSERAIFVIDKQGRLAYRDVSPDTRQVPSTQAALDAIEALSSPRPRV